MKNVKIIFFGEHVNYLFLLAAPLFCLIGCKSEMPDGCDEDWMGRIYVKEYGTEVPIEGASVYLVLTGNNNSHQYIHDETTDVNGYAEWPCMLDYDNLNICAGEDYWEDCYGMGYMPPHPPFVDGVFYLHAKAIARVYIPWQYHDQADQYGYVKVYISPGDTPEGYNGSTEYGRYQDHIGKGGQECEITVYHFGLDHQFTGQMENYFIYLPPHDTTEFFIPEPE
jgi:hypothetical protein